jgi:redox-sensitive bicupin YhaK (pirin superfamily)
VLGLTIAGGVASFDLMTSPPRDLSSSHPPTPRADSPDDSETPLDVVVEPRERDLGDGFVVRRLLPSARPRAIGPFVFFDHFGPTHLGPGRGLDVRPHPHINLATVTYLFEGEILHRDSLGSQQVIRPGDINWMTAGRGIVHSERTPEVRRAEGSTIHGLQLWVALPRESEEVAPEFHHHPGTALPSWVGPGGVEVRVLVGEALGVRSPVKTLSRVVYLDVRLEAGAVFDLPDDAGERGIYVVAGDVTCADRSFGVGRLLSFRPGRSARVRAEVSARMVLVGGDPLPEPRHIWWNFVSSTEARIEAARRDWQVRRGEANGPFPLVPGDEQDFIPLPLPAH